MSKPSKAKFLLGLALILFLSAVLAMGAFWLGIQIIFRLLPQNAFFDWILFTLPGLISLYLFFFFAFLTTAILVSVKLRR